MNSHPSTDFEEPVYQDHFLPVDSEELSQVSASTIVESITIPVSIELSRIRFSISELGSLHSGQIIELNKAPGEYVDLVVSGKIIGKGELIEIEGEIGVRIVSLVK